MFTRDQISDWLGINRRTARRFVRDMLDRRLAAEDRLAGRKVCRISARAVYRALGAEDIRHRRIASAQVLLRRLLSLDYVIGHTGLPWLPTEPEKVGAFEGLGLDRRVLPVRVYRGVGGETRRYFPSSCPSRLTASARCSSTPIRATRPPRASTPGAAPTGELWGALRERGRPVEAVAVVLGGREFERAEKVLGNWTAPARSPRPVQSIRDRPPDPPRNRPDRTGHPRHGRERDPSVRQSPGLPGADRRTQGRAPRPRPRKR